MYDMFIHTQLIFMVVLFYEVSVNIKPLFLGKIQYSVPVSLCSRFINQPIHNPVLCFCLKTLHLIYIVNSLTSNSQQ